jgi:hypothetical protein
VERPDVERTGILVIRARLEAGHVLTLRVRITQTLDVSRPGEIVIDAATPEDVHGAVRAWLEAFMEG